MSSDESEPSWLDLAQAEGFSARDLFHFSSELKIDQKRAENSFIINL